MSKKKVNLIVSILNICCILIILIFGNIVLKGMIENGGTLSLMATSDGFNMVVRGNYNIIMIILLVVSAFSNIIAGVQNKETKKLTFLYFLFAILQIINLIFLKKQLWNIFEVLAIAVAILQFMGIRNQGNQIETNNMARKINIIMHFAIYSAVVAIILIINIIFIIRYMGMYSTRKKDLNVIRDEISTSSAYSINEEYFKVIKNQKVGYINESGVNIIPCEYDSITDFCKTNINGLVYEIAIGVKERRIRFNDKR